MATLILTATAPPAAAAPGRLELKPARFATPIEPGHDVDTSLRLTNAGSETIDVDLQLVDLEAGDEDSFARPSSTTPAMSVRGWIKLPTRHLTIQGGLTRQVPVRISAPPSAVPGAYAVAIVASQRQAGLAASTDGIGPRIELAANLGSTFVLVVPGSARSQIDVVRHAAPRIVWGSHEPQYTATVKNTGTSLLKLEAAVELSAFGAVASRRLTSQELPTLPGGTRTLRMRWTDHPWFGWFQPRLIVVGGEGSGVRREVELPTVFVVPPWWMLLALGAGIAMGVRSWRRRLSR